ncbi:unnamed protein product [Rotaria sp. Silwood1]|nr:unnamed protein product [Rotaria sp. Silwood1]CAF1279425.1 unnamed protein product [Rotaria sp. Silwood1]CAF3523846.1 unnamed protein product [Rotaria sp. Silwood1]CAF3547288.1 unnamed protein product [Rotaria sp. Silwood1]CAF4545499.1 unnamed protein product [Rotaria sp. Silwood1]
MCYIHILASDKDVDISFISEEQKQRIIIDADNDQILDDLINYYSSSNFCPYRELDVISRDKNINRTVACFLLQFDCNENNLFKIKSTKILINNKEQYIDKICLPKKTRSFCDLIPGD